MKVQTLRILLIILIAFFLGYYFGINKVSTDWKNYKPSITVVNKEPPSNLKPVDFSQFWNVWQKLEASYYDKKAIEPQKLLNGAISGMVSSLDDPYTVYLPPKQNTDFKEGLAGQFQGIGAELGMKDKQIIVVAPLEGMPAEKAGVKSEDAILKVDDQPTAGWILSKAVEKIRGPKGTKVTITVLHKGQEKPVDIAISRDTITVKSVNGWIKEIKSIKGIKSITGTTGKEKIAYIRLSQFGDNTNQEWLAVVNKLALDMQKDKSVKGVIFDIRNNPGGYLTDATFIASEFIEKGTVVIQDRGNGDRNIFSVNRKGLLLKVPVAVLINKGSASASEIVAGALRDHNRAKLIGETSFGKGTIQQAEDLGGGAGLHVTIAKWLTPNETWVHGKGLEPDIKVALDEKDPTRDFQLEKAVEELVK